MAVFTYTATAIGGGPENGAFCYVYTRGTTTPATTYSDVGRTIPRTNPIVADADGRVPPAYFADATQLTFVVKTANGATTLLQVEYDGTGFFASYVQIDQLTLFSLDYTADGAQTKALTGRVISSPYQLLVAFDGDLQPTDNYTIVTDGTDSTLTWATNCQPASTVRVTIRAAVLQALSPAIGIDLSSSLVTPTGDSEDTLANWLALKAPLDSPAFTGSPTAPTAAFGTNTTQLATTAFVQAAVISPSETRPIVVVVSGQSNANEEASFSWTPATNQFKWNWNGTPATTGTAFAAPSGSTISLGSSFAKRLADTFPDRLVYVVNIALGGAGSNSWLPSPSPSPDMYATLKSNVEAALTVLGLPTVDLFLWWQGETDAALGQTSYPAVFTQIQDRLKAETWWPRGTPALLMGVSEYTSQPLITNFNKQLTQTVSEEPETRTFVDTSFLPSSAWDNTGVVDRIHLLGAGYNEAGSMAANAFLGRSRWASIYGYYVDPVLGTHTFTDDVVITGSFTSLGIDDNATGERLQLTDAIASFGVTGAAYTITHAVNDQALVFSGGNAETSGANIALFGGTNGSFPDVGILRSGATNVMSWNAAYLVASFPLLITKTGGSALTDSALQLISTDAGTAGPALGLYHNSASPAANDASRINFFFNNSSGTSLRFATVSGTMVDPTAASEDGLLTLSTLIGGTFATRFYIGNGAYTVSATGGDMGLNTINASNYFDDGVNINAIYTTIASFTSTGIDDNATGERLQIADALINLGTAGSAYVVAHAANDQALVLNGGNTGGAGASINLFGGTNAVFPNVGSLQSGATVALSWSSSSIIAALPMTFSANATFNGAVDFTAIPTVNADPVMTRGATETVSGVKTFSASPKITTAADADLQITASSGNVSRLSLIKTGDGRHWSLSAWGATASAALLLVNETNGVTIFTAAPTGAVNFGSLPTVAGDPVMTRGATETITGVKTFSAATTTYGATSVAHTLQHAVNDQGITISGGNSGTAGAVIGLLGGAHGSFPGVGLLLSGSTTVMSWSPGGVSFPAGTTAKAPINFVSGVAPTSPNNGDFWFDGTNYKARVGGVTKTFTLI